jgi:hypothetical protein
LETGILSVITGFIDITTVVVVTTNSVTPLGLVIEWLMSREVVYGGIRMVVGDFRGLGAITKIQGAEH